MAYLDKSGLEYLWGKITNKLSGYVKTSDMADKYGIEADTVPILKDLSNPVANSLDSWGIEINGLKNSFTADGKYHRVIASVDMGDLEWGYELNYFFTPTLRGKIKEATGIKCDKYATTGILSADSMPDKSMHYRPVGSGNRAGSILLKDSSYTTLDAFKSAMRGQIFYYELTTPVDEVVKVASNEEISKINENAVTLGYSGKNLLNVDRNIPHQSGGFIFNNVPITLKKGTYKFTFNLNYVSSNRSAQIIIRENNINIVEETFDMKTGKNIVSFSVNKDTVGITSFYANNSQHTTDAVYSDIMLRSASITDDTYEPYKPSVDERLEGKEKTRFYTEITNTAQASDITKHARDAVYGENDNTEHKYLMIVSYPSVNGRDETTPFFLAIVNFAYNTKLSIATVISRNVNFSQRNEGGTIVMQRSDGGSYENQTFNFIALD